MLTPGEYLKAKYSAPSDACKCGNCQLVPLEMLAQWDQLLKAVEYASRKVSLTDAERVQSIRHLLGG